MRIALIGCMVMNREISRLIAESRHVVRAWWMRQGLHDTPDKLRTELQRTLDEIEEENEQLPRARRFEVVVLAYGLCSNGVVGLRSRSLPVIVPRCDDCISLFLGSAERYQKIFRELEGVYWYNAGWIEQAFTPSKANYALQREEYAELYGEENADYLMECSNHWMTEYKSCGFITCPLGDDPAHEAYARQAAADFGWTFRKLEGRMEYLHALVNGPWEESRFLVCPPNCRIEAEYTGKKVCSVPAGVDDRLDRGDGSGE